MQLHQITRHHKNKKSRQIGRGGRRGKTSGRGTKGQKARAGAKIRPIMRDIIKKIPKLRGYRFHGFQEKPVPIYLSLIDKMYNDNDVVNPQTLLRRGCIEMKKGKYPIVKILSQGEINKKVTVANCSVSQKAREKIEKSGGVIKE